jgi:PPK2 family polyphosphate:nucleotide phosphotransferase
MTISRSILDHLHVEPGKPAGLAHRDTAWDGQKELHHLTGKDGKKEAERALEESRKEIASEQELLYASDQRSLLVIFQAMDAAGKDGTIKHVMSGVNPQGCEVRSFKQPSSEELDHDFLWRIAKAAPERGRIGIFNRSHYEEVLVVRVHPEFLERQKLPPGPRGARFWKERYQSINDFERHLHRNGTTIVKFFLHVSREEQRQRLLARLEEPGKEWKFSAADVAERHHWDAYMHAYEDALTATSTTWAPWYVIPADHKPLLRVLVAGVLVDTIRSMDLAYPTVSVEQQAANEEARKMLEAEGR